MIIDCPLPGMQSSRRGTTAAAGRKRAAWRSHAAWSDHQDGSNAPIFPAPPEALWCGAAWSHINCAGSDACSGGHVEDGTSM